ncbi:MAG: hypothetical protein QXS07_02655 [Candidatus Pacearchaeota archaeon]
MKKSKKGFALFPILIVIVALIIFNMAFYGLLTKTKQKIKNIEQLDEILDYRWFVESSELFLNNSIKLAYSNSLKEFFLQIDRSETCRVTEFQGMKCFSLSNCYFDKTIFFENFNANFNKYLESLKRISERRGINLTYACSITDGEGKTLQCNLVFEKNFTHQFLNLSIKKKIEYKSDLDFSELDKLESARKALLKLKEANKLGQGELEQSEQSISFDGIGAEIRRQDQDQGGRLYAIIKTKEKFFVQGEQLKYEPIEVCFIF